VLFRSLNRHADANLTDEDIKVVVMNWSDETISILDSAGATMFKRRMERKDNGQA
jgi:SHS2 domain-containing protein